MHLFGIWLLLFLGRGQCDEGTSVCSDPQIDHGIAIPSDPDDIVLHPYDYHQIFHDDTNVTVQCDHGYKFTGTNQRTGRIRCRVEHSEARWQPSEKEACRADCLRPSPEDLSRRLIQILTFDARDQMEFGCTRDGFLMFGDPVLRCQNGNWSLPLPVCRFKWSCLLRINNGIVTRNRTVARPPLGPWARHNDYGEAHCDPGYAISGGIKHVKCKRGNWDPKPTCSPACIIPPSVTADRPRFTSRGVNYTSHQTFPHGRYLNIECPNGKVLTSTMEKPAITINCTFGDWSNSTVFTEKCEPDPCEELDKVEQKASIIQYGMIPRTVSDGKRYVRHGTEINFTCKRGYHVKDCVYSGIVECRGGRYYDQQQEQSQLCKPARKIFLSRQEWASFLGQECCSPMRDCGYAWNSVICPLNWTWPRRGHDKPDGIPHTVLNECSRPSRPSPCLREEVHEYSQVGHDNEETMQVWAALLGVKVPKFGNQCCWTDTSTTYQCFEYPSWLN